MKIKIILKITVLLLAFMGTTSVKADTVSAIRTLAGHTNDIRSAVFSPDGSKILTGAYDGKVILWDASTGNELRTISAHKTWIFSVAFSPDGSKILTGSYDATAKLWGAVADSAIWTTVLTDWVVSVSFSTDGAKVFTGENDGYVRILNAATGKLVTSFIACGPSLLSAALTPDGSKALVGCVSGGTLLDVSTGMALRKFSGLTGIIYSVTFSPNGSMALVGSDNKTAGLFEVATGQCVRIFTGHSSPVNSVAFSPNGSMALTGSGDKTAKLWSVATGKAIRVFAGHADVIHAVAFSPDGSKVVTGSSDNTAKVWDISDIANAKVKGPDLRTPQTSRLLRIASNGRTAIFDMVDTHGSCPDLAVFSAEGKKIALIKLSRQNYLSNLEYVLPANVSNGVYCYVLSLHTIALISGVFHLFSAHP